MTEIIELCIDTNSLTQLYTGYEKKLYERYGGIINVCKSIEYDLKHGVTTTELFSFLQIIVIEPSFSDLCKNNASLDRLHELKEHFP